MSTYWENINIYIYVYVYLPVGFFSAIMLRYTCCFSSASAHVLLRGFLVVAFVSVRNLSKRASSAADHRSLWATFLLLTSCSHRSLWSFPVARTREKPWLWREFRQWRRRSVYLTQRCMVRPTSTQKLHKPRWNHRMRSPVHPNELVWRLTADINSVLHLTAGLWSCICRSHTLQAPFELARWNT